MCGPNSMEHGERRDAITPYPRSNSISVSKSRAGSMLVCDARLTTLPFLSQPAACCAINCRTRREARAPNHAQRAAKMGRCAGDVPQQSGSARSTPPPRRRAYAHAPWRRAKVRCGPKRMRIRRQQEEIPATVEGIGSLSASHLNLTLYDHATRIHQRHSASNGHAAHAPLAAPLARHARPSGPLPTRYGALSARSGNTTLDPYAAIEKEPLQTKDGMKSRGFTVRLEDDQPRLRLARGRRRL